MPKIESVYAYGKIYFIPIQPSIPTLPDMRLLFLNEEERGEIYPWRAVCIELEIDAVGDSMNEAWDNLCSSLTLYIEMEKKAVEDSIIKAAEIIKTVALTKSTQKEKYFALYHNAKDLFNKSELMGTKAKPSVILPDFFGLNNVVLKRGISEYDSSRGKRAKKAPSRKDSRISWYNNDTFWLPLTTPFNIPSRDITNPSKEKEIVYALKN